MFAVILFVLLSVALSTSQLNVGPHTFPEQSSLSSQIPEKRFVNNQGLKYIIKPIHINNDQNIRSENQQLGPQIFKKQAILPFLNFSPSGEFQVQNRQQIQVQPQTFTQNEKPTYINSQGLSFLEPYTEQKPRIQYQLVRIQQGKQLQKEFNPITQYSNKDQLESNLLEEIRLQLNRIVDNNQINLSTIVTEENKLSKAQTEQSKRLQSINQEVGQEEEGLRKKVEDILRGQNNVQPLKQDTDEAQEPNYQKSPFFIQRLVTKTNLHPVNIVKQVKISVPTPILVPVPKHYEVKISQPYHVPVEVIRHIPVPLRRHH